MRYSSAILPLVIAGGAVANPLIERGACSDSCCAAVTADSSVASSHCESFLKTTIYPLETFTATVYGFCTTTTDPPLSCKPTAKKRDLTVCPNAVPTYANSCSDAAAYSSACSFLGIKGAVTTISTTTTTTKIVWSAPTGWTSTDGGWVPTSTDPAGASTTESWPAAGWPTSSSTSGYCKAATTTIYSWSGSGFTCGPTTTATVTATKFVNSTLTLTKTDTDTVTTATPSAIPSTCVTDADAKSITDDFINLLEFTQSNFNTSLANALLADNFTDTSDSINFMAGIPLTTVTFGSKAAFIGGQGTQPAIPSVVTQNIWHDCHTITWRWRAFMTGIGAQAPVTGINFMIINDDKQIETNYSEFDNGAWLLDLGNPQCSNSSSTTTTSGSTSKLKLRRDLERHMVRRAY